MRTITFECKAEPGGYLWVIRDGEPACVQVAAVEFVTDINCEQGGRSIWYRVAGELYGLSDDDVWTRKAGAVRAMKRNRAAWPKKGEER